MSIAFNIGRLLKSAEDGPELTEDLPKPQPKATAKDCKVVGPTERIPKKIEPEVEAPIKPKATPGVSWESRVKSIFNRKRK